jgi:hypothetical protein|tara:strand:+ start:172 stop:402 length:231 start_codon:yes stop_codon:yes gene_type:complete
MKETHYTRLLNYLREFNTVTSLDAIRDLGNTRLAATIHNLRRDGHNIITKKIKVPTRFKKKNGEKVFTDIAEYRLK